MSFQDKFYESVAEWLRIQGHLCDKVNYVDQETESMGYCNSCWSEYEVIVINYDFTDEDGLQCASYTYSGNMAEFIGMLP